MAQPLKDRGFLRTANVEEADIAIMNTCTVRDQAEHRAESNLGRLRPWKAANPNRILIVAGCAASRWGDSIKKKFPFIDVVSPATRISQFPETVAKVLEERWNFKTEEISDFGMRNSDFRNHLLEQNPNPKSDIRNPELLTDDWFGSDQTAYVTIMRGCNYSCSYCIVPQVRGREVYRPMPEILAEIERKTAEGYREVMLLGQTVNSYYWRQGEEMTVRGGGGDERKQQELVYNSSIASVSPRLPVSPSAVLDFSDLLYAVQAIPTVERIRFMSPHPKHMKDRVIQAIAECSKVARHLHLPLQSGSNEMLSKMKRLYTRDEYRTIIEKLRVAVPDLKITTDIIVGYPGEGENDFQDSMNFMKEIAFNSVFAFKYSPRPGTASAPLVDDVLESVKDERLQQILTFA